MKKLFLTVALAIATLSAGAQTTYSMLRCVHPDDFKHYTTDQLRSHFMMPSVMEQDKVTLTYFMYDRLIYGGVKPVTKTVELETIDPLP